MISSTVPSPSRNPAMPLLSLASGTPMTSRNSRTISLNWSLRSPTKPTPSTATATPLPSSRQWLPPIRGAASGCQQRQAFRQAGSPECRLQVVGAFGEVAPAVVVKRDHLAGTENLGRLRGLGAREGEVGIAEQGSPGRAREEDGDVDGAEPSGDGAHDVQ